MPLINPVAALKVFGMLYLSFSELQRMVILGLAGAVGEQ